MQKTNKFNLLEKSILKARHRKCVRINIDISKLLKERVFLNRNNKELDNQSKTISKSIEQLYSLNWQLPLFEGPKKVRVTFFLNQEVFQYLLDIKSDLVEARVKNVSLSNIVNWALAQYLVVV